MRAALILLFTSALALSACSGGDGDGTSITVNTQTETGKPGTITADGKTGAVRIDAPGFKANITLPKIRLDAGDFEMNGVKFYPGSTIGNLDISEDSDRGKDADDAVTVTFTSPAAAGTVRDWFRERLTRAKFTLANDKGNGLVGTTDEGKPFRLDLAPKGNAASEGTITISG